MSQTQYPIEYTESSSAYSQNTRSVRLRIS